ncbi:hypothetical protein HDU97_000152 [Phlyctochytrium planicorne]|nr:hypothetical protein HDU97_000152 [Phlyctochytrium planicorne]
MQAIQRFPLEIVYEPGKGRYAVASRDLVEGDLVLQARSFGIALFNETRKIGCATCFSYTIKKSSLPHSCSICSQTYYCRQSCKTTRTPFHERFECRALSEISNIPQGKAFKTWINSIARKKFGTEGELLMKVYDRKDIQDLARWCLNFAVRNKISTEGLFASSSEPRLPDPPLSNHNQALELVANSEMALDDERKQLECLYEALKNLTHASSEPNPTPSDLSSFSTFFTSTFQTADFFTQITFVRQCNGFGLWDDGGECLGQSLYPWASYFNHSCDPNLKRETGLRCIDSLDSQLSSLTLAEKQRGDEESTEEHHSNDETGMKAALFREPLVSFYANRPISRGTAVTHSYIDPSLSYDLRQTSLKQGYFFDCLCSKCEGEKPSNK